MKAFKRSIITIALLVPTMLWANKPERNIELHIGDKMPEIKLNHLFNYPINNVRLSQIANGKAIIIDFFATWCGACVKALPNLDQLQKKYKNQLQVLVVSNEDKNIISNFLRTNGIGKHITLPFIYGDSALSSLFPHHTIPHEIWIDKEGTIKAITSFIQVTDENVHGLIAGKLKALPLKKDLMDFSPDTPLFQNGNGGDGNNFLSRSLLIPAMKGAIAPAMVVPDSNNTLKRILVVNRPPLLLFYIAYSQLQLGPLNYHRIFMETKDSTELRRIQKIKDPDRYLKYCYCYEYIPTHSENWDDIFSQMLQDLNRYFSIYGTIEIRNIPCWVLISTSKNDSLLKTSNHIPISPNLPRSWTNVTLDMIVRYLNWFHGIEPVVNGTGYNGRVTINMNFHRNLDFYPDINAIRKELQPYGLDLVKENRNVKVLVIRDKK